METKNEQLEYILESLINGQREQMTNLIDEYGLYDFWADFKSHLKELDMYHGDKDYFSDAVISYHRIKNR